MSKRRRESDEEIFKDEPPIKRQRHSGLAGAAKDATSTQSSASARDAVKSAINLSTHSCEYENDHKSDSSESIDAMDPTIINSVPCIPSAPPAPRAPPAPNDSNNNLDDVNDASAPVPPDSVPSAPFAHFAPSAPFAPDSPSNENVEANDPSPSRAARRARANKMKNKQKHEKSSKSNKRSKSGSKSKMEKFENENEVVSETDSDGMEEEEDDDINYFSFGPVPTFVKCADSFGSLEALRSNDVAALAAAAVSKQVAKQQRDWARVKKKVLSEIEKKQHQMLKFAEDTQRQWLESDHMPSVANVGNNPNIANIVSTSPYKSPKRSKKSKKSGNSNNSNNSNNANNAMTFGYNGSSATQNEDMTHFDDMKRFGPISSKTGSNARPGMYGVHGVHGMQNGQQNDFSTYSNVSHGPGMPRKRRGVKKVQSERALRNMGAMPGMPGMPVLHGMNGIHGTNGMNGMSAMWARQENMSSLNDLRHNYDKFRQNCDDLGRMAAPKVRQVRESLQHAHTFISDKTDAARDAARDALKGVGKDAADAARAARDAARDAAGQVNEHVQACGPQSVRTVRQAVGFVSLLSSGLNSFWSGLKTCWSDFVACWKGFLIVLKLFWMLPMLLIKFLFASILVGVVATLLCENNFISACLDSVVQEMLWRPSLWIRWLVTGASGVEGWTQGSVDCEEFGKYYEGLDVAGIAELASVVMNESVDGVMMRCGQLLRFGMQSFDYGSLLVTLWLHFKNSTWLEIINGQCSVYTRRCRAVQGVFYGACKYVGLDLNGWPEFVRLRRRVTYVVSIYCIVHILSALPLSRGVHVTWRGF